MNRNELQPGDIMLYRGKSLLAKAIRLFDGADVNHAAICLPNRQIGEAIKQGVVSRDVDTSLKGNEFVKVRRLKDLPPDMSPVLGVADNYLSQGQRYAYEQILLLAFLGLTRKPKVTPILRALLRTVLDAAAVMLNKLIAGAVGDGNRQPMICSEFVYRCYDEARPELTDIYALSINRPSAPATRAAVPAGAMATPASAATPASRGSGVHPDSLLAWAATPTARVWSGDEARPSRGSTRGPVAEPATPTQAELDALIKVYLDEVKEVPSPSGVARTPRGRGRSARPARSAATKSVSDEELRAAIDRFAVAYSTAESVGVVAPSASKRKRGTASARPQSVSLSRAQPFENLVRTASDFVTPGDLLKTESLFSVGTIVV
ncbi:MAG: hypothetical protein H7Z74_16635 [Anaerolineae bacterium]|nr:hypothetical protein [Gemmatimonadaceae bacterium]